MGIVIFAILVLTIYVFRRQSRSTRREVNSSPDRETQKAGYVEYLAKLEDLRTRGAVSQKTYLNLKKDFSSKLEHGTGKQETKAIIDSYLADKRYAPVSGRTAMPTQTRAGIVLAVAGGLRALVSILIPWLFQCEPQWSGCLDLSLARLIQIGPDFYSLLENPMRMVATLEIALVILLSGGGLVVLWNLIKKIRSLPSRFERRARSCEVVIPRTWPSAPRK
ncbi:MAG: hypothetical protein ABSG74_09820 [Candidatus Bathyarchaeia archaeon]|jgi:hypothetical protein